MGGRMKLTIALGILLASGLAAQAASGGATSRSLASSYAAISGPNKLASNASHVRGDARDAQYNDYTSGGNVNPWSGPRTCY